MIRENCNCEIFAFQLLNTLNSTITLKQENNKGEIYSEGKTGLVQKFAPSKISHYVVHVHVQ